MEDNTSDNMDFSKLKVPELKKELKLRHLSTAGNKTELMERLLNFVKNKQGNGSTVDDLEEDLLNDEDDDHLDDENDALLTDLEKTISESETTVVSPEIKPQKRKSTTDTDKNTDDGISKPKKITLTRKPSINIEQTTPTATLDESKKDVEVTKTSPASNGATRKIIKFSELSVQERLEMRSKKFGTPLSADAAKQTRAERFGINDNKTILSDVTVSVDVLKQRAKRFGVSVSPSITKLENLERLELRKSRFGAGAAANVKETAAKADAGADKAKAARLERFK